MVSDLEKATAISRLKFGDAPINISADLGLPTKLVEEWRDNLDVKDLVKLQANTRAMENMMEVIPPHDNSLTDKLKTRIEETALEIVDQVSLTVCFPDPSRAKALQLLANTCSTLYTTLINKDAAPPSTGDTLVTLFQQLSKD